MGCPELAAIPDQTVALLRNLAASENVSLVILSGRSISDLQSRAGVDCILAGNHGLEIEGGGISFVHECAGTMRHAVDCACWDLEAALAGVRGVLVERKGLTATVHYRQVPVDLQGWLEAAVGLTMRRYDSRLSLRPARKAWEVLPRIDWNKGSALLFVLRCLAGERPLVICAGDDVTDEDMFRAVPEAISIQVGGRSPTAARYHLNGPAQLAAFLENLLSAVRAVSLPDDSGDLIPVGRRAGQGIH